LSAFALFTSDKLSAIAQFAIVLGIMVIVHELGHFIVAKLCGVRVEAFAIGFGKRLFGIVHNGTDYRVNLFPVGGYVKMAGMEFSGEAHPDDPGEFQNHPRWQRTLIALAGPVFNFILAFILLTGLYMTHNEVPAYFTQGPVADYVTPDSAAARTGIKPGDRIVFFDNQNDPTWGDIEQRSGANFNHDTAFSYVHNGQRVDSKIFVEQKGNPQDFDFAKLGVIPVEQPTPLEVSALPDATTPAARAGLQSHDKIVAVNDLRPHSVFALLAYLQDYEKTNPNQPVTLTIQRNGATLPISITPYLTDSQEGKAYRLGFVNAPTPMTVERAGLVQAASASWHENVKNSRLILDVLHRLFTRQVSVKSLSSPIGMGVMVHEAFQMPGWYPIIMTMAMISLNLGIFNLLPIPILDGGMITFLAIESLMRRDLNQQVKERVFQVAFVCIVLFAAVVIFNDITKMLPTQYKP